MPPPPSPERGAPAARVIVGGGITGLLCAWRTRRARPDEEVVVLEAGDSPGGVVASAREDGFLIERAASTMRPGASAILEVVRELGLEEELVAAAPAARKRWILSGGRLVRVPSSPLGLVGTPLVAARAKLRAFREPWIARGGAEDETLAGFVARRFGEGLVEPMLDAVVTGIFAGDPRRLEARAAFPRLVELEARHGSVLRGLLREGRARRASAARPAPRRGGLLALRGGMQQLVDRLAAELGDRVRTGVKVVKLAREPLPTAAHASEAACGPADPRGWRLECAGGGSFRASSVLLATPSWESARLVAPLDRELARELAAVEAANVAVVGIGVAREQVGADVDGLGFLVPSAEGTPLLGVLFESSLFPDRAPPGHLLLRAMVGGERARFPADPRAVAKLAWLEASRILRIEGAPRLLRAFLHQPGIPQYRPGHTARLRRIHEHLAAHPGLKLAGWSYSGIALDDRARESASVA